MGHLNPKNGQGDGAGFRRLQAAQTMRMNFQALLAHKHPTCTVYIDQIREYAGAQIVFFRATPDSFEQEARCAVFAPSEHGYVLTNDVIVNQE